MHTERGIAAPDGVSSYLNDNAFHCALDGAASFVREVAVGFGKALQNKKIG